MDQITLANRRFGLWTEISELLDTSRQSVLGTTKNKVLIDYNSLVENCTLTYLSHWLGDIIKTDDWVINCYFAC